MTLARPFVTTIFALSLCGIVHSNPQTSGIYATQSSHQATISTPKHFHKGRGEILNISNTSVMVAMPRGHLILDLPWQNLSLRAGVYPVPISLARRILVAGQWVHLSQNADHVFMRVQPAAFGKLVKQGNQWTISVLKAQNPTSAISWPLAVSHIPRLGQLPLAQGNNVEVFGTLDGSVMHPTLLAPSPIPISAQLQSNISGILSFASSKHGSFVYHPPAHAAWLKRLTPKTPVILTVNPITHDVLAVRIRGYQGHCVQCLRHNTLGQLVKTSANQLQLKTAWGTQTLNLSGMDVKICDFSSPAKMSLRQLPVGSELFVHWSQTKHRASIRILPKLGSS